MKVVRYSFNVVIHHDSRIKMNFICRRTDYFGISLNLPDAAIAIQEQDRKGHCRKDQEFSKLLLISRCCGYISALRAYHRLTKEIFQIFDEEVKYSRKCSCDINQVFLITLSSDSSSRDKESRSQPAKATQSSLGWIRKQQSDS